jgi:hypothetical protein
MKVLFWIYIVGVALGFLSYILITLKMVGYCKRKDIKLPKKHLLEEFASFIKMLFQALIPLYPYMLFLSLLFTDEKKLEIIMQEKIDKYTESEDTE